MKLVPLGDKVVLKQLEAEETTKSGIVLPGQAKEKPQQAEVIAVGPGAEVDGKLVEMQVKPGDKVVYSKYSGSEVKLDDVEYTIVKQAELMELSKKGKHGLSPLMLKNLLMDETVGMDSRVRRYTGYRMQKTSVR